MQVIRGDAGPTSRSQLQFKASLQVPNALLAARRYPWEFPLPAECASQSFVDPILASFPALKQPLCSPEVRNKPFLAGRSPPPTAGCRTCPISWSAPVLESWVGFGPQKWAGFISCKLPVDSQFSVFDQCAPQGTISNQGSWFAPRGCSRSGLGCCRAQLETWFVGPQIDSQGLQNLRAISTSYDKPSVLMAEWKAIKMRA